jgi:hypothetical protein
MPGVVVATGPAGAIAEVGVDWLPEQPPDIKPVKNIAAEHNIIAVFFISPFLEFFIIIY